MTAVLGAVAVLALGSAVFFAVRCALLKRSLRQANKELAEIVRGLEDNRIVKLPQPDKDLEALLGTVNQALAAVRGGCVRAPRGRAEGPGGIHQPRPPHAADGYRGVLGASG